MSPVSSHPKPLSSSPGWLSLSFTLCLPSSFHGRNPNRKIFNQRPRMKTEHQRKHSSRSNDTASPSSYNFLSLPSITIRIKHLTSFHHSQTEIFVLNKIFGEPSSGTPELRSEDVSGKISMLQKPPLLHSSQHLLRGARGSRFLT